MEIIGTRYRLALETRSRESIDNEVFNNNEKWPGIDLALAALKSKYSTPPGCVRGLGYVPTYNCHGLTFASRRANIKVDQIAKILRGDGYAEVSFANVMAGDIIIYYGEFNSPDHSGIVVHRNGLSIYVLSKFGSLDEVVHLFNGVQEYASHVTKFWRMVK